MRNKRRLKGFTRAFFCWASCLGKRVSRRRSSSVKWRTSKVIQNQKFRRYYWVVFSGAVFVVTYFSFFSFCLFFSVDVGCFFFFFFFLKLNSRFKVLRYCYLTDIFGFEDFSSISTIHSTKKHTLTQRIFWSDSFCQITTLIDKEPTPQTWKIWFSEFAFHPVWALVSVFI